MNGLFLKGQRNYLSATTIMDYIISNVLTHGTDLQKIDFSMSRFTDRICDIIPAGEIRGRENSVIGQFSCRGQKLLIVETGVKLTCHIEYHEEMIFHKCRIEGDKTIVIPAEIKQFSFIEKTVAAYKVLLERLFTESYRSFFFIRVILEEVPTEQVKITFDRIISQKYFQATLSQSGHKVGSFFFGARR